MAKFAEIIVKIHNLPDDRSFTYRIPEGMKVSVGSSVIVPFGKRRVTGYCIALTNHVPPEARTGLKEIEALSCELPLLTPELIRLAEWGAGRFLCSRIDLLAAMVPPAGRKTGTHRAKLLKEARITAAGREALPRGKKQKLALDVLRQTGSLTLSQLAGYGISPATVYSLEKKGWLLLEEKESRRNPLVNLKREPVAAPQLTPSQKQVLEEINKDRKQAKTFLLHGVTGSGKTEVYMQAIAKRLQKGLASIVLVPEISLTPQIMESFFARFGDRIAILHSRLSTGERYDEWCRVASGEALVVIGARSAVFAPVKRLGLIIIDEEHESTYKQEENPRYHARDIALWRAAENGADVILGSATPSLETYTKALQGGYQILKLPKRIADKPLPAVEIVDMRQEMKSGNRSVFSRTLSKALWETLQAGKQAMLFLNRRGYATFVLCRECGHVMRCPDCNVALKFHNTTGNLCCHYCEYQEPYPKTCPACGGIYIRYFGAGTQKVEKELLRLFPAIKVLRMDADTTTRKGQHQKILESFRKGKADVLVGTQMIAKGHDFANVTLVGVITADTALNLPDFRAGERTFQMITQVAGRAGRGTDPGRVIVQTYNPDHYAVLAAKNNDYEAFYQEECERRRQLGYPPFGTLVRLLLSGTEEKTVIKTSYELAALLGGESKLAGPSPCPLEKVRGRYRWQIVVLDNDLSPLLLRIKKAVNLFDSSSVSSGVRLSIDVEPQSLL